jgi:hypothetical protein
MWNTVHVQNIRLSSENLFQVLPSTFASLPSHTNALASDGPVPVTAIHLSALWVLLIHALGSYICYITGMFCFIQCVHTQYEKSQGTQTFPFSVILLFPHKLQVRSVGNICKFIFRETMIQNLTENWLFLRIFPKFTQKCKGNHAKLL